MSRASISTLAAATLVLVALATVAVAALRVSREGSAQLAEYLQDLYRVYSTSIEVRTSEDGVVVTSSTPLRLLAAYLVEEGGLVKVCEEVYVATTATIGDGHLVDRLRSGGKLLLVFEGGRYLLVGSRGSGNTGGGDYETPRLLSLLAQYLRPEDYDSITRQYVPVATEYFSLDPYYAPQCGNLLYVSMRWYPYVNPTHWVVTFRKCSEDGPVLENLTVPKSQWSIPYREWLFEKRCTESEGVRYCFEVYVGAQGSCEVNTCSSLPDAAWYYEVTMRVIYRFEAVDPGYYVLVVLNRTTYDVALGRYPATCTLERDELGRYYVVCGDVWVGPSRRSYDTRPPSVVNLVGYRTMFWWEVGYNTTVELRRGDDGLEEGAWYGYLGYSTPLRLTPSYAYTYVPQDRVYIQHRLEGLRVRDYLAHSVEGYWYLVIDTLSKINTNLAHSVEGYKYGYYRVYFKLVYDEGGFSRDSKTWDYRVVVFLLRKLQ